MDYLSTLLFSSLVSLLPVDKTANIYEFTVKDINLNEKKLSTYEGKVLLIVNVASKCGYTRQYEALQKIYEQYGDKGLVVMGFPCNDFGGQEPGTNEQIQEFCSTKFNVTFPMFDKVKVLGEDKDPLFAMLTDNDVTGTSDIKWNFEKFLIDKNGNIIKRFRSSVEPDGKEITSLIEQELRK